jgi:RHS repeat-associated protein
VIDHTISPEGFKDSNTTGDDFDYDDYGNIKKDKNKGITTDIRYNHLNLPTEIVFANGDKIQYVYNAEGKKLEKTVVENNVSTTTKYLEGFQYVNNVLNFFPHAEGYVAKQGSSTFKYVFNHTDHLGNIRLKYCDLNQNGSIETNEILEENNYYPFGLKHNGYNTDISGLANKYRYNYREYQSELGLNLTAMDFRQYDAALGRFNGMDRLTELAPGMTPYRFGFNNPTYWSDPTGLFENRAAAMAHISQYGLTGATVSYNNISGYWEVENDGVRFWDKGKGNISYTYAISDGIFYGSTGGGGGSSDGFDFSFLNDKSFNTTKTIFNTAVTKISAGTNLVQSISEIQIIKKLQNGGSGIEAVADWRSLDKLRSLNKGLQTVGYVGLAIDGIQYVNKVANGEAKTSDHIRIGISAVLTFVAVSNPIGIVAIAAYGIFDAYYGDEIWKKTGIDN